MRCWRSPTSTQQCLRRGHPGAGVREANVRKPTKTRVGAFLADGVPEQPRSIEIARAALCDLQEQAETVVMLADGRGSHEPICKPISRRIAYLQ